MFRLRPLSPLLVSLIALAGCAHAPKPEATEVVSREAQAPVAKPQLVTAPVVAPELDPRELQAALNRATIYFDFDRDLLKPEGQNELQRVATLLRTRGTSVVKIEGNCDERGTEEYNLMLGQRRADATRRYLLALGVRPEQLETISYGSLRPVNPGHSEEAWSANRRAELQPSR